MSGTIAFEDPDDEGWIVTRVMKVPGALSQGRAREEAQDTWATNYNRSRTGSTFDLQVEGGWTTARMVDRYCKVRPLDERRRAPSPFTAPRAAPLGVEKRPSTSRSNNEKAPFVSAPMALKRSVFPRAWNVTPLPGGTTIALTGASLATHRCRRSTRRGCRCSPDGGQGHGCDNAARLGQDERGWLRLAATLLSRRADRARP